VAAELDGSLDSVQRQTRERDQMVPLVLRSLAGDQPCGLSRIVEVLELRLVCARDLARTRTREKCQPQRQSDRPRHRAEHDVMPEGRYLLVGQDSLAAALDPALLQPGGRIGFEQISVNGKVEHFADETVHTIGSDMLAGADNTLD